MKNALYHTGTDTTIQFPKPPTRGGSDSIGIIQAQGFDSDGRFYAYTKNRKHLKTYPLVFDSVPGSVTSALLIFMESRNGDKNSFTFYDHESAAHTVRFETGQIRYQETQPDRFRVSFTLNEEL